MTIGDRIRQVRKESGLTQTEFSARIKIGFGSVSKLERGENKPADRTIALISKEFGIREEWLRDGTGPMREESTGDELDAVLEAWNLPREFRALFIAYGNLRSDAERDAVRQFIYDAAEELVRQAPTEAKSPHEYTREEFLEAMAAEWDAEHSTGGASSDSGTGSGGTGIA